MVAREQDISQIEAIWVQFAVPFLQPPLIRVDRVSKLVGEQIQLIMWYQSITKH